MRVVRCAGCQQENPSDRKFCGQCGDRLWLPCLECESTNAVDEKFCGNCGVKLVDSVRQREDELKSKLQLAIGMEREGRYYEATSLLREITEGDERLGHYTENALKLLEQIEERRVKRTEESGQLEAQARVYFDRQEFTKAFESLKGIPVGLRSRECTNFMIDVEKLHNELSALTNEIRVALKAKNYGGLKQKVDRLCRLQPGNSEARKLSERLAKAESSDLSRQAGTLAKLAQAKVAEHHYREASDAVARIEPQFRKGQIEQVFRTARELHWCTEQLKRSTFASADLAHVAGRWKKLAPADGRAEKIATQLGDRLKARPRDRRVAWPAWTTPPESTPLSVPVRPWSGFRRADVDDEGVQQQLADSPGRFLVAYGLALQGLGLSKMTHDLNPRKGILGGLLQRKKVDRIWGLDIGSTSVKALELVKTEDSSVEVQNCLLLPHSRPLHVLKGDGSASEMIAETLEQFVEETGERRPRVAASFPGRLGLARFFDLPPIKSKKTKLKDAVGYEVKLQIPVPLDEAVFDFHAWNPVGDGFTEVRPVASIAARKEDLTEWVEPINSAGCDLAMLQCDGFALFNALYHEYIESHEDESAFAVIDVGGDTTNLVVGERNFVWMRSIVHGTKRWNDAIERDLPVSGDTVEKLRHNPASAKWMHQVIDTLEPDFAELLGDLQRSLNGYPRKSVADIGAVLCTGGGSSQFGFLQTLTHGAMKYTDS